MNHLKNLKNSFTRECGTIAVLILLVVATACTTPTKTLEQKLTLLHSPQSEEVMIACHRAAHNGFPENSLPAMQQAIDLGVDIIETDVRVSKDNIPFIMHDGTLNRTTNGEGPGEQYTMDELKQFRLRATSNGELTDEKIPTLKEVLLLAKGKIIIDLDLKTNQMIPVVKVIKETGTQDQIVFYDSNYDKLDNTRKLLSEAMLMPLTHSYQQADSAFHRFGKAAVIIHIYDSFYTPQLTQFISANNARTWINALGKTDEQIRAGKINEALPALLKYGANIIQTDEPELILDYLKKQ